MKRLTYKALRRLEPGKVLADPGCRGLRFIGGPKGVYAQFRWKDPTSGKWQSKGLGRLPEEDELEAEAIEAGRTSIHFDDAIEAFKQEAFGLRRKVRAGVDPRTDAGPDGLPLKLALDKYEASLEARKAVKTKAVMSLLRRELLEPLGNRPLGTLDRPALLDRMREIEAGGRRGAAKEFQTRVSVFFGWAVNEGMITGNPLGGYKRPRRTKAEMLEQSGRAGRALADKEAPILWRAADAEGTPFGPFVQILLLTGQRRMETTMMQWENVDLDKGVWNIPAEVTKSGRAHKVPLPPLAVEVLRSLLPEDGKPTGLVFVGRDGRPMTGHSKRMIRPGKDGPQGLRVATEIAGMAHWTFHDLRRTFRTGLSALGVDQSVAELMLNHSVADELLAAYDRHDAWDERVKAARLWADHVASLIGPGPQAENVVPLRA